MTPAPDDVVVDPHDMGVAADTAEQLVDEFDQIFTRFLDTRLIPEVRAVSPEDNEDDLRRACVFAATQLLMAVAQGLADELL